MYTISRAHQSSSVSSPSAHVEIENLTCPMTQSQEGVGQLVLSHSQLIQH